MDRRVVAGYLMALAAGALWGTTGPLSTALYAEGALLTDVGFWRVLLAVLGFLIYGLFRRDLFRIDRSGLLLIMLLGGALVALFEVAFQYAIAGVGVAGAVTLLYVAPVMVAVLAHLVLRERLTPLRLGLAVGVMVGVALTVTGGPEHGPGAASNRTLGVIGGLLSAVSYTGTTLLARYTVPTYGVVRVLFYELLGGVVILGVGLSIAGRAPVPSASPEGWAYIAALGVGSVLLANFAFFGAVRRIEAAPTAVAASIEPVVGALLALILFRQGLTTLGWVGLCVVVAGVAAGYRREAEPPDGGNPVPVS